METPSSELPRGTVTFLFTDIERSTELARQLGAEFGTMRAEHRRVLREAFARHDGHEIETAGDGFFVVFQRAGDAIAAAAAGQRALAEWDRSHEAPVRVRMGLHTAEPFVHEDGYVGVGVHRAARICAVGHGGQILLSNATAGVVEDLGLVGVNLHDLGEHRLKDMERPQALFQLDVEGLEVAFPPLESLDILAKTPVIVTLLATDLVGWSKALRKLGDDQALVTATTYQGIVRDAVDSNGGRVIDAIADSVLALFERPQNAVLAAIRVRDVLRHERWIPLEHLCPVRCGVHSGRVVDPQAKHLGSAALRSVRLCDSAEPWQILVSHATEALLEGDLLDFRLTDLGERTTPSFDQAGRVFAVSD